VKVYSLKYDHLEGFRDDESDKFDEEGMVDDKANPIIKIETHGQCKKGEGEGEGEGEGNKFHGTGYDHHHSEKIDILKIPQLKENHEKYGQSKMRIDADYNNYNDIISIQNRLKNNKVKIIKHNYSLSSQT